MKLDNKTKTLITTEYNSFKEYMYANSPKEIRDQLGQFFTPAGATVMMLEKLENDWADGNILDPTSGSGNLLSAAIIAGADPDKVFGNDYDARMVKACRERIKTIPDRLESVDSEFAAELRVKLAGFRDWQIHRGDATDSFCLKEFGQDYKQKLEEHYLYDGTPTLFPMLTPAQEEFLKEVD